jgi:hypothetical protein
MAGRQAEARRDGAVDGSFGTGLEGTIHSRISAAVSLVPMPSNGPFAWPLPSSE